MPRSGHAVASTVALAVLVASAACLVALPRVAHGQLNPGPSFPFYDNCRRNATFSRWSLRQLPLVELPGPPPAVRACFVVRVNNSATCPEEIFRQNRRTVVSRCCNTSFAKIKFYVDARCRSQFQASPVTVPGAAGATLNKNVSPSFDGRPANYTEVKYTRFGPVPQNVLNGTTFCLTLRQDGPCNVSTLLGITSPFNRPRRLLQVALYDRKVDNYECCPTFNFRL